MIYSEIIQGIFIKRVNRFIAICLVDSQEVIVHVKNTGRCKELLIKGYKVYLEKHNSTKRKTSYSLISVEKGIKLINMDSQAPNKVIFDAIINKSIILPNISEKIIKIRREVNFGQSRFDIYIETEEEKIFIEIKGVTLEEQGVVMFPDAPTERGVKHILELIQAIKNGYKTFIIFVIQMSNIKYFMPNINTHKKFADTLLLAKKSGVNVLAYDCNVTYNSLDIYKSVDIKLQ